MRSTQLDLRSAAFAGQGLGLADRPSAMFDFDSTGAVTTDGRLQYRVLFTAENQRYFTENVLDRNRYMRGSLLYRLDRNGLFTITPVFQYGSMLRPAGGGLVISPSTSLSVNDGLTGPIHTSDLSPHTVNHSAGQHRYYTSQAGFDFRAVPGAAWTANLNYRWMRNDRHINQWTPVVNTAAQMALLAGQNEVLRQQAKSDNRNRHRDRWQRQLRIPRPRLADAQPDWRLHAGGRRRRHRTGRAAARAPRGPSTSIRAFSGSAPRRMSIRASFSAPGSIRRPGTDSGRAARGCSTSGSW